MCGYTQKSFTCWVSYYDTAVDMDDDDRLAFYDALFAYMFTDVDMEQDLKQKNKAAYYGFKGIKANMKTSKLRSASGKAGNDARWHGVKCDNEEESHDDICDIANESQKNRKYKFKDKDKDKDKGKSADVENVGDCGKHVKNYGRNSSVSKPFRYDIQCPACRASFLRFDAGNARYWCASCGSAYDRKEVE